jgi:tetratricopeptide (TPR) repeat protein
MAIHSRPGGKANFRRNLNRVLQQNPRDVAALTHRGFFLYVSGDYDEGARDYARALELTAPGTDAHRHVLWSWGWALLESGQDAQALVRWQENVRQAAPRLPFWVPYSYAVAHWRLGDRAQAIAWYDAAVRADARWATSEGHHERTASWRDPERAAIAEVHAAWRATQAASP